MIKLNRMALPILSLFLFVGCFGGDGGDTCIEENESGGTLIVNVGCGGTPLKPIYSWDSDKKAFLVEVERTSDDELVWSIISFSNTNVIVPPIDHGEEPFGTFAVVADEVELELGVEYIVKVTRLGEDGGEDEKGTRRFIIPIE